MRPLKKFRSFNESQYDAFSNRSGKNFWGDYGAGVLPICTSTGKILVGLRSEYVNEPFTWGLFGGMIDNAREKQNPELAAKRELREETGVSVDFEVLPAAVFKNPGGGFTYYNFIGLVPSEYNAVLDWETEHAKWVSLAELKSIKPKHFGLTYLIKNSADIIERYAK